MKNHVCKFVLLGFLALTFAGCGGTSELPPSGETNKVDPEKHKEEMKKAMELNNKKGVKLPGN